MAPLVDLSTVNILEGKKFTIRWVDESKGKDLAEEGPDDQDLVNLVNPAPIILHKQFPEVPSIMKGSVQNSTQKIVKN